MSCRGSCSSSCGRGRCRGCAWAGSATWAGRRGWAAIRRRRTSRTWCSSPPKGRRRIERRTTVANITLKDLFDRLNPLAYRAAESAAIFCKTRGNPTIELEHFLYQVLMLQDSDLHRVIKAFNLNGARIASDLQAALDKLPRGATRVGGFSDDLEMAVKE